MSQSLTTIVVVVVVIIIVLWILYALTSNRVGTCVAATPDPVGGVKTDTSVSGEVTISWDPTPNATRYRIFVNTCPPHGEGARKTAGSYKVACGPDGECCAQRPCTTCVSQSNYTQLIETSSTSIVIETCEPCICYMIVPYNHCGQAGSCKEVNYVNVNCVSDSIEAWIIDNDCNGLQIGWNCEPCCTSVEVFVHGVHVDTVPCSTQYVALAQPPTGVEIAVRCISDCGTGALNILRAGTVTASIPSEQLTRLKTEAPSCKRPQIQKKVRVTASSGPERYTVKARKDKSHQNVRAHGRGRPQPLVRG